VSSIEIYNYLKKSLGIIIKHLEEAGVLVIPALLGAKLAEHLNISVPAGESYMLLDIAIGGRVHEVLIISPSPEFSVKVTVDGVVIWDKSYSEASAITDELVFISAFQREDGKYVYHLSEIPFKSSIKVEVINISQATVVFDKLLAKYEVM